MGKQHHGDLDESVVDDAGADVDDVEDGERHQQVVERRSHLGLPEVETIIKVLNVTKDLKLPGSSTSSLVPLLSQASEFGKPTYQVQNATKIFQKWVVIYIIVIKMME